jgi:hypothetical protein
MTGTVDRWGARRVYVVTGIIKYPHPTITELDDYNVDMQLYKAQTKTEEELEIESYINFKETDITKYNAEMRKDKEEVEATNSEVFLPENDD